MPEISFDFTAGNTLEEAALEMRDHVRQFHADGHRIVSVSHAADVSGDEPKWSILALYAKD